MHQASPAVPSSRQLLLDEIEAFLHRHAYRVSSFGRDAVGDAKLIGRLREGKTVSLDTADRIRAFMHRHAAAHAAAQAAEQSAGGEPAGGERQPGPRPA